MKTKKLFRVMAFIAVLAMLAALSLTGCGDDDTNDNNNGNGNGNGDGTGNGDGSGSGSGGGTWTAVTITSFGSNDLNAIAYGGGKFVAGGGGRKVATSQDGITWTPVNTGDVFNFIIEGDGLNYGYINVIAFGSGKSVAGGIGGKMATSPDGVVWTAVDLGNTFSGKNLLSPIEGIAYGNGRFVVVGWDGTEANSGRIAYFLDN